MKPHTKKDLQRKPPSIEPLETDYHKHKRKMKRPYVIECRFRIGVKSKWGTWRVWKRYVKLSQAQMAFETLSKKKSSWVEFRFQPPEEK